MTENNQRTPAEGLTSTTDLLARYVRQQLELTIPDPVLDLPPEVVAAFRAAGRSAPAAKAPAVAPQQRSPRKPAAAAAPAKPSGATESDPLSRLSRLKPVLHAKRDVPTAESSGQRRVPMTLGPEELSFEQKRAALKEIYLGKCDRCHLAASRTSFVFGSGNVDAPLMAIGEAPGEEEDRQGLPFVGAAGRLLTDMLKAINLDRSKDVFIANVLKCRPPQNRNPETSEILACMPLLEKQIAIIRPKLILLLGKIAAHSLLNKIDSIAKMRGEVFDYAGIPAIVTYHPAALLRNAEYKRPAWEDLKRVQAMLKEMGVYGETR